MNIGRMRQRVTLQRLVETPDAYGQLVKSWTTVGTYWADVVTLSGREAVNAIQIKAEATHRVTLRYSTALDPTMQLVYLGRVLKIHQVVNTDQRNREYVLLCSEIVSPTGT